MYKNELDRYIQNNSLSRSFILFGESDFFIDRYTKVLTKRDDASYLNLYYDEYNFSYAKDHLSQASLFGGDSILIIKSEKKIPKKDLEILIDLCEKNDSNLFVYAYYGDSYTTYTNLFKKKATMSVRFFHPSHKESINIVAQLAREKSVKIDTYSINHLLDIHNGNLSLVSNEINKFMIYDKEITTKDIDKLVYGLADIDIDVLIKKLLNKKDFKYELKNILEHGEDETRVLTKITSYITQLYLFNIYIRVNGTHNSFDILGYNAPSFVVKEKATMSLRFKPDIYFKLHQLLLSGEMKMKQSTTDKGALLFSILLRVQKIL